MDRRGSKKVVTRLSWPSLTAVKEMSAISVPAPFCKLVKANEEALFNRYEVLASLSRQRTSSKQRLSHSARITNTGIALWQGDFHIDIMGKELTGSLAEPNSPFSGMFLRNAITHACLNHVKLLSPFKVLPFNILRLLV